MAWLGDSLGRSNMDWKQAKSTQRKTKSLARSVQYLKNVGYATVGNSNVREFGLDCSLNK